MRSPYLLVGMWLAGCQGETVEPLSMDAAPDAAVADTHETGAAADTATCEAIPGNLVPNASFEETDLGWGASVEGVVGAADDCQRWARFTSTAPWESASISIVVDGKAGDVFEFGMSVQRLDDQGSVDVFLQTPTAAPERHVMKTLANRGEWARAQGTLTLTGPVESLTIGIGANTDKPRVLGVDRVWLLKR